MLPVVAVVLMGEAVPRLDQVRHPPVPLLRVLRRQARRVPRLPAPLRARPVLRRQVPVPPLRVPRRQVPLRVRPVPRPRVQAQARRHHRRVLRVHRAPVRVHHHLHPVLSHRGLVIILPVRMVLLRRRAVQARGSEVPSAIQPLAGGWFGIRTAS